MEEEYYEGEYLIKLKEDMIDGSDLGYMFRETYCWKLFRARIIQFNSPAIFELSNSKAICIIPCKWIEWMAPVKQKEVKNDKSGNS